MDNNKTTIDDDGTIYWYNEQGQLHREDGPAVEYTNGDKEWWLNWEQLTEEEFNKSKELCNYTTTKKKP